MTLCEKSKSGKARVRSGARRTCIVEGGKAHKAFLKHKGSRRSSEARKSLHKRSSAHIKRRASAACKLGFTRSGPHKRCIPTHGKTHLAWLAYKSKRAQGDKSIGPVNLRSSEDARKMFRKGSGKLRSPCAEGKVRSGLKNACIKKGGKSHKAYLKHKGSRRHSTVRRSYNKAEKVIARLAIAKAKKSVAKAKKAAKAAIKVATPQAVVKAKSAIKDAVKAVSVAAHVSPVAVEKALVKAVKVVKKKVAAAHVSAKKLSPRKGKFGGKY